jgi:MFS family permease
MNNLRHRFQALATGLPRTYWLLWIGTFINRLGGFVVPFLTLYLTDQRGMPVSQAALMVSLFGAGSFTAALVGGELSDRLGRRPVLLISFLLAPVNLMILGFARSATLIAPLLILQGFFTDLYRPAVNAAVADLVLPADRPRAYGYIYWAINLGFAFAPALAGLLARWDYLLLFVGDSMTTFIFGMIVLWGVRETRPQEVVRPSGTSTGGRLIALRREPLMLIFSALALAFGTIYMQGNVTLPLDMRANGLGPNFYGLAISVNGAIIVLLGIPASNAMTRLPRFGVLAAAALLLGSGFGLTGLAHSLPIYALSVAIWTLGEIAGATIAPAIVADLAPIDMRGLYQGIFGAAWGLALFTGPVIGGWVYEILGPGALWTGCLALGALLAVAYLAMSGAAAKKMQRTLPAG